MPKPRQLACFVGMILLLALQAGYSTDAPRAASPRTGAPHATTPDSPRSTVKAVTDVGPGQAGFVHYFLITHPDGELEYHVGIELDDQRIAWSFPEVGVMVWEFAKKGTVTANGATFKVEHLHGIRPFANTTEMVALQKALPQRVAMWVDAGTPYCVLRTSGQPFCLNCGDFVVRLLWPGPHPLIPSLPRDFVRATGAAYNTDDLLLYLTGLHQAPNRRAALAHLATLDIPTVMREELLAMIGDGTGDVTPTAVAAAKPVANSHSQAKPTPASALPAQATPTKSAPLGRIATRRTQAKRI